MNILALDLTSAFGSLAVRVNGRNAATLTLESTDGFAHLVFPAIADVLSRAGVSLAALDCFAAACGPGSFTGVRVGLASVKGLAFALGKPAAGISNLRALSTFGGKECRAVILDARRGDVYAAVYDHRTLPVLPETVTKLPLWLANLPAGDYDFIAGPGVAGVEGFTPASPYLAEAVALCAERDGEDGLWSDPAALDANYVRRSDAELFWKDK